MNKENMMNRRQFLKIIAVGGAAGAALGLGLIGRHGNHSVSTARLLMGTVVNLTLAGEDRATLIEAMDACIGKMMALEGILSRFLPDSELSQLNRKGRLAGADAHLLSVLDEARKISLLSAGAFDITVKPLVDLHRERHSAGLGMPEAETIADRLTLVDFNKVVVVGGDISLELQGMAITLDGIAKGYIVDEGVRVLREHGMENVLVEAGGDLLGLGRSATGEPWKIRLQPPRRDYSGTSAMFSISDKAMATSGDYMQRYDLDYLNFHIIDPRTGYSPRQLASVSIMAPTAARADALATAVMVMGPDEGMKLINGMPGHKAYLVTKEMQVIS